jgi:hypothetical protein
MHLPQEGRSMKDGLDELRTQLENARIALSSRETTAEELAQMTEFEFLLRLGYAFVQECQCR